MDSSLEVQSLELLKNSSAIDFQIKRSRRKSVAIHVANNQVEVRAPYNVSKQFIDEFVQQKRQWILDRLIEQEQKESEIYQIADGASLPFLGDQIMLSITTAKRNSVKLSGLELQMKLSENSAENRIKQMDKWLLNQAKTLLPDLVMLQAEQMKLQDRISGFKFRKTKTKWGHCTAQGVIQLNPLILLAPEFVLQYLIIHELSHLVYQNHSKQYWALVERYDPNYKQSEVWLTQQAHCLWYR